LKLRGWVMLLLFAHVMLHPWVHALGAGHQAASECVFSHAPSGIQEWQVASDQCELCRVGHSATVLPHLPTIELLNPRWIHTVLQAVNYASLQADHRLPSRAPPLS
jgi:hypothetical protein